jgi:hypothetical protein
MKSIPYITYDIIGLTRHYHWSNRYARDGILGLINKKAGAGVPYNKTSEDIETKIVQIASDNKELDANDIWDIVTELYGFDKTVRTIERILQQHQINRGYFPHRSRTLL